MKTIGTLIRDAREKKNLTREQAAKRLGISSGYLSRLEIDSYTAHLSPKLARVIIVKLGAKTYLQGKPLENHNRKTREWYRAYFKKAKSRRK